MPGRNFTASNYRYDFNGKESDKQSGWNTQDYGFRNYDPRLGRFFSQDPLFREYPELTPYQFASNRPIDGIDLDGKEYYSYIYLQTKTGLTLISKIDYTNTREGYGKLGPGVSVTVVGLNGKTNTKFVETKKMSKTISQHTYAGGKWLYNNVLKDGALEGGSDGGNVGRLTKQDVKVGGAMIGILITGGTAAFIETGIGVTLAALSTASNMDDLSSDPQGNTFVSKLANIEPESLDKIKLGIAIGSLGYSTKELITKTVGVVDGQIVKSTIDNGQYTFDLLLNTYDAINVYNNYFESFIESDRINYLGQPLQNNNKTQFNSLINVNFKPEFVRHYTYGTKH